MDLDHSCDVGRGKVRSTRGISIYDESRRGSQDVRVRWSDFKCSLMFTDFRVYSDSSLD